MSLPGGLPSCRGSFGTACWTQRALPCSHAGAVPASGLPCTIGFPVETLGHLMDPIWIGDMALAKLPKQSNNVRDQNGLGA